MKKLILAFLMASVSCFAQNVKVGTPANPSQNILSGVTINNSTNLVVPGTFTVSGLSTFNGNFTGGGADYLLNSQTLTGNGSVLTRILGDARYSAVGGSTTNSNIFAPGSTNDFDNLIVRGFFRQTGASSTNFLMGLTTISNAFNVVGNSTIHGNLTVTNGSVTVAAQDPTLTLSSTNVTGQRTVQFNHSGGGNAIIGASAASGQFFIGNLAEDFTLRGTPGARIVYGLGTTRAFNWNGTSHTFEIGNVIVSNNLTVVGSVTSSTNNSTVYQVSGVTGFSGVVTNDIGVVTNIMFYGSGILTNLTRIGP